MEIAQGLIIALLATLFGIAGTTPAFANVRAAAVARAFVTNLEQNRECLPLVVPWVLSSDVLSTQHTLGHVECPACQEIQDTTMHSGRYGQYLVPDAARVFLASRKGLSDNTRRYYEDYIQSLKTFFALLQVNQVHIGHVVAYQRSRQEQIRGSKQHQYSAGGTRSDSDGASRINHEISCVLRQVLKAAGRWSEIAKFYEPLPLPKGEAGMALTDEEEDYLFQVGRSRSRWAVAYSCDMLSRNTSAGPGEIRHLRIRNVDLRGNVLHIEEGVKNDFRVRPVPLNDDARAAVVFLLERYERMCGDHGIPLSPEHYLLPHRAHKLGAPPDPWRPMGSWKKAHYAMRAEAAKKFPRLARLRRYDFRHTACTEMLGNPSIAYATIEHIMGHRIGSNTKRRYDHLRDASLRAAVDALNRGRAKKSAASDSADPIRARKARA